MKIERFEVAGLAQYSYAISSDGESVVIDPIRDIDRYLAYATRHNLSVTHILETHIHADFAAGSMALAHATGARLALSAYDQGETYRYAMPHHCLHDGDAIECGSVRLLALHTPGHTPEHLSFILFDSASSRTEPLALFSGDFLFVGSLGRPDLLGDAAKQGLAHELYRSLHQRIARLPAGTILYPGHGAGSLCGAGISARSESTLGYERNTDHLFRLSEDDFVKEILNSVPPMPDYYPRMKHLNARGAPLLRSIPGDRAFAPHEVKVLAEDADVVVLDLRSPEAFGGAHIRGALNIGEGQNLSLWAGWLIDAGKRIVLAGEHGDSEESRRGLVRVGLDRVEGFLAGGMSAWIAAGLEFAHIRQRSVHDVAGCATGAVVLDVRSDSEWRDGHIANAHHIMLGDLTRRLDELPRDRPLITICGSGYRSSIAASILARHGFSDVSSMNGGMAAWLSQGLTLALP